MKKADEPLYLPRQVTKSQITPERTSSLVSKLIEIPYSACMSHAFSLKITKKKFGMRKSGARGEKGAGGYHSFLLEPKCNEKRSIEVLVLLSLSSSAVMVSDH